MADGLAKGRDVIRYRNGNQKNAAERSLDTPAPTVHFGAAMNDVSWVERRPAPTVVTSRRSKDGMLVGRQLPEGEGENVGGKNWTEGQMENAVRVTEHEAATLQGFPPGFPFAGSRTKRFQQIGNAIPPPLAEAILSQLVEAAELKKAA